METDISYELEQRVSASPAFTRPSLSPLRQKRGYEAGKRAMDLSVSLSLLVLLLPVFALIAIIIKASSPGPIFFRQKRLGRNGKEFSCLKFRSMIVDAEKVLRENPELQKQYEAEGFKIKNDFRITPIGGFIRKTSLDELPQLLNVVRNDISLIGPRPIVPVEIRQYGAYADKLLSVQPGLSGLWQTSGRSDTTYDERVYMDMHYIDSRSLGYDVVLMLRTATAVFKREGAC